MTLVAFSAIAALIVFALIDRSRAGVPSAALKAAAADANTRFVVTTLRRPAPLRVGDTVRIDDPADLAAFGYHSLATGSTLRVVRIHPSPATAVAIPVVAAPRSLQLVVLLLLIESMFISIAAFFALLTLLVNPTTPAWPRWGLLAILCATNATRDAHVCDRRRRHQLRNLGERVPRAGDAGAVVVHRERRAHRPSATVLRGAGADIPDRSRWRTPAGVITSDRAEDRHHRTCGPALHRLARGFRRRVRGRGARGGAPIDRNDESVVRLRATRETVDLRDADSALRGDFAFPMFARKRLLGILVCADKADGTAVYAPDELEAIGAVAHAAGVAIDLLRIEALERALSINDGAAPLSGPEAEKPRSHLWYRVLARAHPAHHPRDR